MDLDHLDDYEREEVVTLVNNNDGLFHVEGDVLSATNAVEHTIELTDPIPVKSKIYRYPPCHRKEIDRQVNELLDQGIIRPSRSPYSSPVWLVPKKPGPDGLPKFRMVIDYRDLNSKTIANSYPLPNIQTIIDSLSKAQYFTTIDLYSSFQDTYGRKRHS